jgi:hypothetical protein
MSKPGKPLSHQEIEQIINAYLAAVRDKHGDNHESQTECSYRKGLFYIRHPWFSPDTPGIPYRPQELKELTANLCK